MASQDRLKAIKNNIYSTKNANGAGLAVNFFKWLQRAKICYVLTVHNVDNKMDNAAILKDSYKKLVLMAGFASVATACALIVMKLIMWMYSGSSAVLASLTDSLLDCCASLVNLLALRFAIAPADTDHRFGHYKAESLASLAQAAFIGGSALLLIAHGIDRVREPQEVMYVNSAIIVSVVSIVITLILVSFQAYVYNKTKSQAIGADRYHYLSDVGLNLGVVLALVLSGFGYMWADGLFAILLGIYILYGSYHIGHSAISTLLDRSMSKEDHQKVMQSILDVPGVVSLHDLKTRQAGPQCFIQCHLVLSSSISFLQAHDIANHAEDAVRKLFPDAEITMHMEPDSDETYREVQFIDHTTCDISHIHS